MKKQAEKIHDRLSVDLPINARISVAIVDCPLSSSGEKIAVARSIRDNPLAALYSRSQIDSAQFSAGLKWQKYYDCAEIGAVKAIDPTQEVVDGGAAREMLTDRQVESFKALGAAQNRLGVEGAKLVRDILGLRMPISAAASGRGFYSEKEVKYVGRRFRECLETLAVLWGFAQPKYHALDRPSEAPMMRHSHKI